MSQENVDLVRRSMEAFDNRDLRTVADALDRDVEWDSAVLIDEPVIHGRAAVLEYWERILGTFPFAHEKLRFVEAGEQVCVLADLRAQGAGSGVELVQPVGYAMTVHAGAITCVRTYRTHAEALKAVGLPE
jgi:ketosteroid isomerase-like protein